MALCTNERNKRDNPDTRKGVSLLLYPHSPLLNEKNRPKDVGRYSA